MQLSTYTIIRKIHDSDNYLILNSLTKQADIISFSEMEDIIHGRYSEELIHKGYVLDKDQEDRLYRQAYFEFIDMRDTSETQIFFVPWYACNFSCSYCYQSGYENKKNTLTVDVIDAFFEYITTNINNKKYITLFGGEPLLDSAHSKEMIEYFINKATTHGFPIAIVTNGYTLASYIDIIKKGIIREIQVTLDGTAEIHNKRRYTKSNSPTFDAIVSGIDIALKNNIPINLRIVVDADNIDNLPELASFAIQKGWTKHHLFKTQIGRNYELHYCQNNNQKLFDRASLYKKIYDLILQNPHILEFHAPAFSVSKFLFEQGNLPHPLFDACPGCKTEWAFDYTGTIYPCTAMVGKSGEEVGIFYPYVSLNTDLINQWEKRDVTTIPQCSKCSLSLQCGGGCAAVAKNKTGAILAPDCRPIDTLLSMGISLYFEKIPHTTIINNTMK